ncbi:MAG TPA: Hsp70 family protein [Dactylosporangium sp.]|nr:Hsp70 family protein [Dactylosporangium sp.]
MDARGYRLGVDFGTSNTVAMLAWPDGHVRPLLFDGSPTLPSAVFADASSGLLVGRDAMHAARINPERYEPNPKRRIDEAAVLLGEQEVATVDLIAAVLARVAGEARRVSGVALGPVTVTCPAAWAQTRRGVLLAAAERAGLGSVTLVPEPVAAAQVFHALVFHALGGQGAPRALPGSAFVVYDLGAGTFDASVVRHGGGAFEVLSAEGLSTSGGLDIDAAIVGYLGASHGARDADAWHRLTHPGTSAERRANRLLWDDVRSAKEMLSRTASTMIHIPALEADVPLGRDQFEQLARPILTATVTATRAAIAAAGLGPGDVDGVFLVGGGSRIPLVATLLHQALGKAPTVVEQPELVVAQGAVGASVQFTVPSSGGGGGLYESGAAAASVSAPPGMPTSGVPTSGVPVSWVPVSGGAGGMPGVPVSPAFASAPVTGYPVSPPGAAPSGGSGSYGGSVPHGGSVPPPGPGARGGAVPAAGNGARAGFGASAAGAGAVSPPASMPPVVGPANVGPVHVGPAKVGSVSGGAVGGGAAKARRGGVLVAVAVAVLLVIGLGTYGVIRLTGGSPDGGSGDGAGHGGSAVTADVEHPDVDWTSTAEAYDDKADTTVGYNCPADGSIGTVWGSGPYTTDSSVCTAAVHAGKITLAGGGRVVIKIRPGESSYEGTTQNDIVTTSYDGYPWAFDIVS